MSKQTKAILEMLTCAALWSIGGIFIKLIPWTGIAVASSRSLIAGITFFIYMKIQGIRIVLNKTTLLAGLATAMVYICFVCANKLTTAANSIVLQFTNSVFIVVLEALFLHKRVLKSDVTVVLFTLAGITLCFLDEMEGGHFAGNCIAVLAGLFMAGMFLAVGNQERDARFTTILFGHFFTFLIGLPFMLIHPPVISGSAVLYVVILGVLQLGVPYVLYVRASASCPPLACSLLAAVEPLLNPVWVMVFDGETPGLLALVGGLIVIVSVTSWCVYKAKVGESA